LRPINVHGCLIKTNRPKTSKFNSGGSARSFVQGLRGEEGKHGKNFQREKKIVYVAKKKFPALLRVGNSGPKGRKLRRIQPRPSGGGGGGLNPKKKFLETSVQPLKRWGGEGWKKVEGTEESEKTATCRKREKHLLRFPRKPEN